MSTDQAATGVALIIPAHNEEPVIGHTLSRIPPGLFSLVVVVDNASSDATAEVAAAHGATVIREPVKGYGAACLQALAMLPSYIDTAVFMQADGSEDPTEAVALLSPIFDGRADLVIGSRTLGNAERGSLLMHQAFGNWLATTLIRWFFGHRFSDLGPFRAIRIASLRDLDLRDRNYGWTVEMQVRAVQDRLRILEVPVSYARRVAGTNKVSGNMMASAKAGSKIISVILNLAIRSNRPRA